MAIPLIINGVTFNYPVDFDENWGIAATGWAQAVTSGMLQMAGGSFPLTADADFGANFGLLSKYFETRSSNPATAGTVRLSSADAGVAFRNNANSGNLIVTTDASDNLLYNGHIIAPSGAGIVTSITGTANQIIASSATGAVTLSTPQDIATGSSPTFAGLTLSSPLTVPNGGIGVTSLTSYAVICGGTTSTGAIQSIASVGTSGQVLTSGGPGVLPTFTNATGTGTVNSGTTPNIAYYATSSSILSDSGISRANLLLADGSVSATGAINLNSHKIINLTDGSVSSDAAALGQVLQLTGGTMSGAIAMGSNKITGLANGTSAQDAVTFSQISGFRILQMVQSVGGAQVSTTSSSYVDSNIAATITPASTSSKIKISVTFTAFANGNTGAQLKFTIFRGATDIGDPDGGFGALAPNGSGNIAMTLSAVYLDSPATTSATTYKVRFLNWGTAGQQVAIPAGPGPSSTFDYGNPTILLEEIG